MNVQHWHKILLNELEPLMSLSARDRSRLLFGKPLSCILFYVACTRCDDTLDPGLYYP